MKKQTNHSHRAIIAIAFLFTLLTITACNEKKEPAQNSTASSTRIKPPKVDIHTAVMTKMLIEAGADLNFRNNDSSAALHTALFFCRPEIVKMLLDKGADKIIRYVGVSAMIFAFLTATPYHDTVITFASTLAPISMFYITVFVFKSGLLLFKILSVVCLLVAHCCNYARNYVEFLPILQKITLVITIIWILSLQHFTTITDFESGKKVASKIDDMPTNR